MADSPRIERLSEPADADSEAVRHGLVRYNRGVLGPTQHFPVVFHALAEDGAFLGGLTGDVWLKRLSMDFVWLDESLRGQGIGRQLIEAAERYAIECGATHANLDTSDFQVGPAYYEQLGYETFGVLGEAPERLSYFMRKRLVPGDSET
jgi:GNAT superfamily N-acetyltransferase